MILKSVSSTLWVMIMYSMLGGHLHLM